LEVASRVPAVRGAVEGPSGSNLSEGSTA